MLMPYHPYHMVTLLQVSYRFCKEFITLLLKDAGATDFGRTEVLIKAMKMLSETTKDGEVYHDYCLNYLKAITYLEQLRKTNDEFGEFEKVMIFDAYGIPETQFRNIKVMYRQQEVLSVFTLLQGMLGCGFCRLCVLLTEYITFCMIISQNT